MKLKSTLAALALTTLGAHAAITATADSLSFDYNYEMDVNPSGQDLDAAGSATDWFPSVAGGLTIPQTYSGGVAFSDTAANEELFRTDFGGSITRQNFTNTAPMTLELSVSKVGATTGTFGWFGAALQMPGANHSIAIVIDDDRVNVREAGGGYVSYLTGTDFTTGFHTIRVAKESGNAWYVWVNDILLNADLSTPIIDGNGSFNSGGSWFIGDYGSAMEGDFAVDYIRLEKDGAFAPVPEPSSALLAGLGALGLIRRRR